MDIKFSKRAWCTNCDCPIHVLDEHVVKYFRNEELKCYKCDSTLNLWKVISNIFDVNFFHSDVFSFVGSNTSTFTVKLVKDTISTVTFSDYGIPKGSRILHINYTASGVLHPLERHGNSPFRGMPSDSISLSPIQFLEDDGETDNEVYIRVTWVESGTANENSLETLVNAFEEYSHGRLPLAIVPANTAIEFSVLQYAESVISSFSSNSSARELFKTLSYVPTLKNIIPLICALKSKEAMPNEVMNKLVFLASLRNQIAHTGKTKNKISKKEISECLAAVILGIRYIRYLQE
ncbi:hypothetical protein ACV1DW_17575 [Aeromonas hydrophila]